MPIRYEVDHDAKVVRAEAHGTLTGVEMFEYQLEVAARPELARYDRVVDMAAVTHVAFESSERVRALAALAASSDPQDVPTRFAIIATDPLHFGLGRMHQSNRELQQRSTREVQVFQTRAAAEEWLQAGRAADPDRHEG